MFRQHGIIGISPALITAVIAVVVVLSLGVWYLYSETEDLNIKLGESKSAIEKLDETNKELDRQVRLKEKIDVIKDDVSEKHDTKVQEVTKVVEVAKKKLPVALPREDDTAPTPKQIENSTKRIETLWGTYCDYVADKNNCPTEEGVKK